MMSVVVRWLMVWLASACACVALDNGVALTPPMGWMSWVRFQCNTQCDIEPDKCISENLYKAMADELVRGGYLDAGYDFVAIDDCWSARERDAHGRLVSDPIRFPSGIRNLADYMHSRGLKLGIYGDVGIHTCAGYPGSKGYYDVDARTFAEWGVDMLKFDGCYANLSDYDTGFIAMKEALNRTGRHIVYSCQWPMYARYYGGKVDYAVISKTCNLFRALTDIYDNFYSVQSMIDYLSRDYYNLSYYAGPGAWNDPDQIVIGNFGLSVDQERVQMAMWCMWGAPLLMSNDLRQVGRRSKAILLNARLIAVLRDGLGIAARMVLEQYDGISVWTKPVLPTGSWVIAILNRGRTTNGPLHFDFTLSGLGISASVSAYHVTEVFDDLYLGMFKPTRIITVRVNPTGIYLVKAVPVVLEPC